jgi:hypothetical protein
MEPALDGNGNHIDEVEDEEGVSYYIAEIKERPDGTPLEQKASTEHARALKGRTQCPLNGKPVVNKTAGSSRPPRFLASQAGLQEAPFIPPCLETRM